jgi:hypothetical protein
MKPSTKTGFKILGVVALICGVVFFCVFILPIMVMFHDWDKQMKAGQKYMDSLTEKDFQVWTERTQKYLSEFDPTAYPIGAKPVPPELQQLKILRIDEGTNYVGYIWMGGMDHTALFVKRMSDGSFQFAATYNDESNKVIWPKKPEPR